MAGTIFYIYSYKRKLEEMFEDEEEERSRKRARIAQVSRLSNSK